MADSGEDKCGTPGNPNAQRSGHDAEIEQPFFWAEIENRCHQQRPSTPAREVSWKIHHLAGHLISEKQTSETEANMRGDLYHQEGKACHQHPSVSCFPEVGPSIWIRLRALVRHFNSF